MVTKRKKPKLAVASVILACGKLLTLDIHYETDHFTVKFSHRSYTIIMHRWQVVTCISGVSEIKTFFKNGLEERVENVLRVMIRWNSWFIHFSGNLWLAIIVTSNTHLNASRRKKRFIGLISVVHNFDQAGHAAI